MYVVMLIVILEGLMNKVMRMHHIVELVADELWPSFSKAFEYNNKHYHIHVVIPVNNLPDLDSSPEPEKKPDPSQAVSNQPSEEEDEWDEVFSC